MKLLNTAIKVLKIKYLGQRYPLIVTWPITNRCNLRCRYCEEWKKAGDEMSTEEIKELITELKELGTVRISLSGGEPLVREDIGEIIDFIKENDMSVVLTSNGTLVPEKIEEIKNADVVKLSIEGEKAIHDRIRGEGSFENVIKAAGTITQIKQIGTDKTDEKQLLNCSIARVLEKKKLPSFWSEAIESRPGGTLSGPGGAGRERKQKEDSITPADRGSRVTPNNKERALKGATSNIHENPPQISENPKLVFNSVLTAYNLDQIDFLINLAKKYNTGVRFSALSTSHASQERISPLSPTPEDLVNALNKLITAKKQGQPVLNSLAGLRYLKNTQLANSPEPGSGTDLRTWFLSLASPNISGNPGPICGNPSFSCFAGKAFAHISSDGKLYPCVMLEGKVPGQNVQELGIELALKRATTKTERGLKAANTNTIASFSSRSEEARPNRSTTLGTRLRARYCKNFTQCGGCFCAGTLELNLLLNFKPSAIWNARNLL